MKQLLRIIAFILLAMAYSCNQKNDSKAFDMEAALEKVADTDAKKVPENTDAIKRKIIKEGEITFETSNSAETRKIISKNVAELNGYISQDNVFDNKDKVKHKISIRVPADKFELLLERISAHAAKLESKNINALDVTEEFIDIQARLETKKALENRYKDLLSKANKVEEILAIEREIGNLRAEIDSFEGRLKYLKDRVSLSTLTVVFYEKTSSAFGFTSKFRQALQSGWSHLLWFFIGLVNLWAFILIGLAVYLIVRVIIRNKKNGSA